MKLDRAVFAQSQRLPGGPSSDYVGMDTILGRDTQIDFADFLNRTCRLHHAMLLHASISKDFFSGPEDRPDQPESCHKIMNQQIDGQ
jgi:hypothetical protein